MTVPLVLVSHLLCPYVQRAAIVLAEKGVPFQRRFVDLANKPDWFLKVSPLGKTPVLMVGDVPVFESAVICEYLEETELPRMHPVNPLERAQHRSWMEFGSVMLNAIGAFYNSKNNEELTARAADIRARLFQLENVLGDGPYFAGNAFSVVDAVFGPVFRYLDVFERIGDFDFSANFPKVVGWRSQLAMRASVINAVPPEYNELLLRFLVTRHSALSELIEFTPIDA